MNRTQTSISSSSKQTKALIASNLIDSQWSKTWNSADDPIAGGSDVALVGRQHEQLDCSMFAPLHYERGYAYPLLVWLHSDGGSQCELRKVMPHISLRNHVAIAVRGTPADPAEGGGFCWRQQPDEIAEAAARVHRCIRLASSRYHVHPRRVFIAGFESGGTMALRLGLTHPEWFAGAISLDAPMPQGHSPLGRVNEARRLPLLLANCRESASYPDHRVASDLRLLHAGGFSLSMRQYPGEHELTTEMLADMDRWILEQFCCGASVVK